MNRKGIVARCFRSLAPTLARADVRWRVLDNGSTDGTAEWLLKVAQRYPDKVLVNLQAVNTGVAGGRDILLRESDAEIMVILDSDIEAHSPGWLDRLLTPLNQPEIWVAGPGGHWLRRDWLYYETAPKDWTGPVDVLSGYCQAWKRSAIEAGVKMDLAYSPRWHEDSDCSLQALSLGGLVWHCGDIGLHHMFSHTGDDGSSYQKQMYLISKWRGKGLTRYERNGDYGNENSKQARAHTQRQN